jgi:hypothetical protein
MWVRRLKEEEADPGRNASSEQEEKETRNLRIQTRGMCLKE